MQFSRYISTDVLSVIRNLKCFFCFIQNLSSLVKPAYLNSSSRLIRVSTGLYDSYLAPSCFRQDSLSNACFIFIRLPACCFLLIWRPPALPHRLQCSTIGRLGLNRRVRDGNGCVPQPHRHQKCFSLIAKQ